MLVPAFLTGFIFSEGKDALKKLALDKIKKFFEEPEVLQAWNKACDTVSEEFPIFNTYLAEALRSSPDVSQPKKLDDSLQKSFDQASFPSRAEIASLLLEAWKVRKGSKVNMSSRPASRA